MILTPMQHGMIYRQLITEYYQHLVYRITNVHALFSI